MKTRRLTFQFLGRRPVFDDDQGGGHSFSAPFFSPFFGISEIAKKLLLFFVLLLITSLLMYGCDLFSTRDPDPPSGGSSRIELAQSPEEALTLVSDGISLRDPDLYLNAISENFLFMTTPSSGIVLTDWRFNEEDNFARRLLSTSLIPVDSSAEIVFTNLTSQSWADSAYREERYDMDAHTTNESLPTEFIGIARVTFYRELDGGWRIVRWVDEPVENGVSLGLLRATL